MKGTVILLVACAFVVLIFYGLISGWIQPAFPAPQDYAEAAWINTQSDMAVNRQAVALAQAQILAQAQAQALVIEAQAKADATKQTALFWSMAVVGLITLVIVAVTALFGRAIMRNRELPRQIHINAIHTRDGWQIVDDGRARILDWKHAEDRKILAELER